MRAVFGLVLIVGVALAGGAVMMAKNYISAYQTELAKERAANSRIVPTVKVIVANKPLKYGEKLTKEHVRYVLWPKDAVPEGVFTDAKVLFPSESDDDRRIIIRAMEKDEAVLAVKVTRPGEDAGLTSRLGKGMRAFAIKVDVALGVSGFLRPGDQVDVYWTGTLRGVGGKGEITRMIQANIELLAVDQRASEDISGTMIARTVTVTATSEQVAALAQAQSTGRLSLALVGAQDDTVASVVQVDQRSLLGLGEVQAAPQRAPEKVCTIRTRRGAEVVNIPIPCSN